MRNRLYVVSGPANVGSIWGDFGHTVPEGHHVIVYDHEYCNGGYGPCCECDRDALARGEDPNPVHYRTRERAEAVAARWRAAEKEEEK